MVRLSLTAAMMLALVALHTPAGARENPAHDGTHDFDWDVGTWRIHQERLMRPLTGSTTWVHYAGTDTVTKIFDGANSGIVESSGRQGHLEIYTLRSYDAAAHQWNIYFATPGSGALGVPVVGVFANGRGEFYDHERYRGKRIMVRFRVYDITADSCRFDQSFSQDEGKTWEVNFKVTETRIRG